MARATKTPLLALIGLAITVFCAQAGLAASPASADWCSFGQCSYGEENIPKNTKRWFSAATTKRSWEYNFAKDGYGGSVYKCAGTKLASNESIIYLGCGNNVELAGGNIPAGWRPGWVFIEQQAAGPRYMTGLAGCPGC